MKNQILLFVVLFSVSSITFSQENRSDRGWNNSNQTTYYMGEKANSPNEFRSESYPESETNNPDAENIIKKVTTHRQKAIWADNSTVVSDEKTGHHSFIPYSYVGEDDILWAKRVKKAIDVRIPQNHPLYFPIEVTYDKYTNDGVGETLNEVLNGLDARKNFFQVLKDAATTIDPQTGDPLVSVYNPSLTRKLTRQEVIGDRSKVIPGVFQTTEMIYDTDEFGEIIDEREAIREYDPIDIVGYYIEEEIFFDKRRARLDFRYVSITPLVSDSPGSNTLYTGSELGVYELGTFYFPEVRHLLANHKVFPLDGNLAQRMSFDEFLHRKYFASHIIKESNVYDRKLSDYLPGRTLDRLLEGERIKEQIRLYETDMWNY